MKKITKYYVIALGKIFAVTAIALLSIGCDSESVFFPSFDYDGQSLAERRLMRRGEPTLPNLRFFPSGETIKQVQIVKDKMDQAWSEMLAGCNESGRFECGFCIYLNRNGQIYLGDMQYGPNTPNTPNSAGGIELYVDKDINDLCAIFHTHTSYKFMPDNCSRPTGPSDFDINAADSLHVPGLVYDYDVSEVWGQCTYIDHHAYTFGPTQRPPQRL